jgi:lipid-binding SYLF domain-containing protein
MTKISRLLLLVSLAWLFGSNSLLRADCRETAILEKASAALSEFAVMPFSQVMLASLRKAQGVAIFPGLIKGAVGIGGRHGRGVLLIREADGSWDPPAFIKLSGASAGFQLGLEGSDLVLIFRTRSSLERLMKGQLTLGVGNAVAFGSMGVDNILATDVGFKTGIVSQSYCKGMFAGWFVEGDLIQIDAAANAAYGQYEQSCSRNNDATGPAASSPSLRLQKKLADLSAAPLAPPVFAPSGDVSPSSPRP